MTVAFVVLAAAAAMIVAALCSAAVGALLAAGRDQLGALEPRARARLLLAAALVPFAVSAATVVAAASPWLGALVDHCEHHHHHPHLCPTHAEVSAITPWLLAAWLLLGAGVALERGARTAWVSFAAARRLRASSRRGALGALVLEADEPFACVAGLLRPQVFVSRALLERASPAAVTVVVAHERSHVRHRDPLSRWVGALGLAFHLPGIARWVAGALGAAQEAAADRDAALAVGDRTTVAGAILELARLRLVEPPAGATSAAFGGADLDRRVGELLGPPPRRALPRWALAVGAALAGAALLGAAPSLHHGLETLLGLLG